MNNDQRLDIALRHVMDAEKSLALATAIMNNEARSAYVGGLREHKRLVQTWLRVRTVAERMHAALRQQQRRKQRKEGGQ
ncbi:MAG TPA: hypothetical protein VFM34_05285 [Moraxellaceae bacterium]|nr:hypothetical protein [Moraxellaceae bacterium]